MLNLNWSRLAQGQNWYKVSSTFCTRALTKLEGDSADDSRLDVLPDPGDLVGSLGDLSVGLLLFSILL